MLRNCPHAVGAQDSGEKGAGVGAPFARRGLGRIGDQGAGELVGVIRIARFGD